MTTVASLRKGARSCESVARKITHQRKAACGGVSQTKKNDLILKKKNTNLGRIVWVVAVAD
jgi:hypothetical protein